MRSCVDDLLDGKRLLLQGEVGPDRFSGFEAKFLFGGFVAYRGRDERESSRGQVVQGEASRGVGGDADGGSFDGQRRVGEARAGPGVRDGARDVCAVSLPGDGGLFRGRMRHGGEEHTECPQYVFSHWILFFG